MTTTKFSPVKMYMSSTWRMTWSHLPDSITVQELHEFCACLRLGGCPDEYRFISRVNVIANRHPHEPGLTRGSRMRDIETGACPPP